jgi:hypothetical protein
LELNGDKNINDIVKEMISLLEQNDQSEWAKVLLNILADYQNPGLKQHSALLFIKTMQGGMGSLLDRVLHKNNKPLIEENNKLDSLRHSLYRECKRILD